MEIETNLDVLPFACEGSYWLDDAGRRDACAEECIVGRDWHCGVGDGGSLNMQKLLAESQTEGGLLMSGVLCECSDSGKRFKNICVVIAPKSGSNDRKSWLNGFVNVIDGEIIEYDCSSVYDEKSALKVIEEFGYEFCDMDKCWEWYNALDEGETDHASFIDWFKDAILIDEDQLPEAEFEGPQWTYYDLLDWQDMVEAFYAGAERWRQDQLKTFDFVLFLKQKEMSNEH